MNRRPTKLKIKIDKRRYIYDTLNVLLEEDKTPFNSPLIKAIKGKSSEKSSYNSLSTNDTDNVDSKNSI